MFMATFTSGGYKDYTAFAKTEERARALVVKGYRKMVKENSGESVDKDDAEAVYDGCHVIEIHEGSCWVDHQYEIIEGKKQE
jgi:hypothetical protein